MIDIARLAGVSRMAVSAVLMGTGQGRIAVAPKTAKRIRELAEQLGYRPNPAAQQLAGNRSGVIAMIAKEWRNYLMQSALARLHEGAEKNGWRVLTASGGESLEPLTHLIRDLQAGWIDGLVYLAYENESQWPAVAEALAGVPRAIIAIGPLCVSGVPTVMIDAAHGAQASVRHLAEQGRKRLVMLVEEDQSPTIQTRIKACRETAIECGIPMRDDAVIIETSGWLISNPAFIPRFDELARTILEHHQADAVICDDDFNAAGLSQAFRRMQIRVPDDIALVGWGNLHFSALVDPQLTTIDYDLSGLMSRVIARLQPTRTDDESISSIELIQPRLIVRQST